MSRTKKIIIIISSVLGALLILGIIFFFTLFSLKSINLEFETTNDVYIESELVQQIEQTCDIDFKKSVFLVDKQKTINSIEKNFPDLKVINLETNFPSSITIHLALRQELFAFTKERKTYITDQDLKVLRIEDDFVSTKYNAVLVEGLEPNNLNIELSTILEFEGFEAKNFNDINLALAKNNRTKVETMAYFQSISFKRRINPATFEEETTLILRSHQNFEYNVFDYQNRLEYKLNKLFACDVTIEEFDRTLYKLVVYENTTGEIFARLDALD